MVKYSAAMPFVPVELDRSSEVPMHRQLYDHLREAILSGRLAGGLRLPATRTLATELGVSRNTVMSAFDQLLAEGYMGGKVGAGTYGGGGVPGRGVYGAGTAGEGNGAKHTERAISRRGNLVATTARREANYHEYPRAFRPGLPALDAFPF